MPTPFRLSSTAGLVALALFVGRLGADEPVRFNRDVRPILSNHCWQCHGPAKQESGLRLDSRDGALAKADSGEAALVPGDVSASELVRRILSSDEAERMPPSEAKKPLTETQRDVLRRWVEQGVPYERHWSFEAPVRSRLPAAPADLGQGSAPRNEIDLFIAERLRSDGLALAPEASRETLVRRVAFALTGLPPTLAEVDAYLADDSPLAYERMVDRYLESPRFGEEMARHWLDVARYGDTHGLHLDNERQMWAYRDWVVRAFNNGMPFDQFTTEQLAGDLLPNSTDDQLTATGFNRCNVSTSEGGSINEEWIFRNAVDRTTTMAETWMGLTAGCCVCHDHKFDPLPTKEFYSLYAFFYSAADPAMDGNALLTAPTTRLMSDRQRSRLDELGAELAARRKALEDAAAGLAYVDPATIDPPPAPQDFEQVWFDDEFPAGAKVFASPGDPTRLVTAEDGQVASGLKALRRSDAGLAQDVFEGTQPLAIPGEARLFAHVWIDPQNPPKTLMLQYHKQGWLHRAVWGDYDAIQWGAAGTTQRVLIGELPEAGKWVRLECSAAKVGLSAGDEITGFAVTQFGGTVYWDKVGVVGRSDPAADPRRSFLAWWRERTGQDTPGVPQDLAKTLKDGPQDGVAEDLRKRLRDHYLLAVCADTRPVLQPLQAAVDDAQRRRDQIDNSIPATFVFRDLPQPRESFVMLRGQYNKPGDRVEPGVPAMLPPLRLDSDRRANRLDLARWLMSAEHPLTARVTVNRIWQQLFGIGLVKTSFDFGAQGEPPTHPELLDWLAVDFREAGWDMKGLVRQLVCSATFRQSSRASAELLRLDPENRLLGRGPRFRLDAEQVRDNSLALSGRLDLTMGGRGTHPYQPANIWEPVGFVGSNTSRYTQDHGSALYRRSLYTFLKRTAPPPFMVNFDAPSREAFCSRRDRTNTPLQALQLLNDVQHFEAARGLAERLIVEGGAGAAERVRHGFRLVLARAPEPDELAWVEQLLARELERYRGDRESAEQVVRTGESAPRDGLDVAEVAAYTLVANLLLNLDETVCRN